MSEWKPIGTAPKDQAILGYEPITSDLWCIAPMYWDIKKNEFVLLAFHKGNIEHTMKPTHWQLIPDKPEAKG